MKYYKNAQYGLSSTPTPVQSPPLVHMDTIADEMHE